MNNEILKYIESKISFHYSKNDLTFKQKEIYFQYKLEGYDQSWSDPSLLDLAHYPNLPQGDYEFLVRASSAVDNFDKPSVSYPFRIKAPFYKRTAFIAAAICSVILFQLVTMLYNV